MNKHHNRLIQIQTFKNHHQMKNRSQIGTNYIYAYKYILR